MKIDVLVKELIERTFNELRAIGNEIKGTKPSKSKIIFPKYRKGEKRVSEQELRQVFIEKFNAMEHGYFYSIETPTTETYSFKDKSNPKVDPKKHPYDDPKKYQSARIDMCIYDSSGKKRIAILEFKSGMPSVNDIKKDFLKLKNESPPDNPKRYFIHLVDGANNGTRKSLEDKFEEANRCPGVFNVEYFVQSLQLQKTQLTHLTLYSQSQ